MDDALAGKIKDHYIKGQGSIQDIARVYHVSVEQVLHIIGQDDLTSVETTADLVDADEAGPGADINYQGEKHRVPFTLD